MLVQVDQGEVLAKLAVDVHVADGGVVAHGRAHEAGVRVELVHLLERGGAGDELAELLRRDADGDAAVLGLHRELADQVLIERAQVVGRVGRPAVVVLLEHGDLGRVLGVHGRGTDDVVVAVAVVEQATETLRDLRVDAELRVDLEELRDRLLDGLTGGARDDLELLVQLVAELLAGADDDLVGLHVDGDQRRGVGGDVVLLELLDDLAAEVLGIDVGADETDERERDKVHVALLQFDPLWVGGCQP